MRIIELDETLPFDEGQVVNISVEAVYHQNCDRVSAGDPRRDAGIPDINAEDVDCLEAAIAAGRLPMSAQSIFDDDGMYEAMKAFGDYTAEAQRAQSKEFLVKRYSELGVLGVTAVNTLIRCQ